MPLGLGPRFIVEAAFLVAVAVAAAVLSLTTPAIVAVMGGAWLLVAALEWGLSRRAAARQRAATTPATPARAPTPQVALSEPVGEPEPLHEPVPPEAVAVRAPEPEEEPPEAAPPPLPEPVPPAVEERVELVAVPEPEPQPEPEPEPEPVGAPVVHLDVRDREPREWNLWDLERAAREAAGENAERDEERSFLLMYLRDFAGPDGSLPASFDALVRDSFGDLLGSRAR